MKNSLTVCAVALLVTGSAVAEQKGGGKIGARPARTSPNLLLRGIAWAVGEEPVRFEQR